MIYWTEKLVREAANSARTVTRKADREVLEETAAMPLDKIFDVFLCHSIAGQALVRGAKTLHSEHARDSKWCPWEIGYFGAPKLPGRNKPLKRLIAPL